MSHFLVQVFQDIALIHEVKVAVMSDLFETLWTVAHQAPLFMGRSRQEYWSGLLFPPPGEPRTPVSPALAGGFFTTELPGKPKPQFTHL